MRNATPTPRLLGYSRSTAQAPPRPLYAIYGAEGGYSTAGDIVRETIDGRPISDLWTEFHSTLDIINNQRNQVTNLLSFRTVASADLVAQTTEDEPFELASEFGEPTGLRPAPALLKVGYPFHDFDKATRFTWRFLRDATAEQIETIHRNMLASDNRLTTTSILARLMSPTATENSDGVPVYGLYNGDTSVPPRSGFNTFTAPHTHYLTSGTALPDGADIEDLRNHILHHGYGSIPGSQLLLFCNPNDIKPIAALRAGVAGATYDFIPSTGAPAYLSTADIIGDRPPGEYQGLRIAGSYADIWVAPIDFMPPGYLLMCATDGPNANLNPVSFRQHIKPDQQGLRLLPGNQSVYPLIDSYYTRGFGVGVRHRGAAAVMQITVSPTYTAPSAFAGVVL